MKCLNCGNEIPEGGNFCIQCGSQVKKAQNSLDSIAENFSTTNNLSNTQQIPVVDESVKPNHPTKPDKPKKKKKKAVLITTISIVSLLIIGLVVAYFMFFSTTTPDSKVGPKIDEICELLKAQDYDSAKKILDEINLEDGSQYAGAVAELREIIELEPKILNVNTDNYPRIEVLFETNNTTPEFKKEDLSILNESNTELAINSLEKDGKKYTLTYITNVNGNRSNIVDNLVFTKYKNVEFSLPVSYFSQHITYTDISYVTSNVENYPEISLYLRVVDEYGNPVENLTKESFAIKEQLDINDFIERDVIYASKIDGNDALNVSLTIDRSDSIEDSDMVKIKNATNTFLSKLQFHAGDKAEIVSFDTNVMQMCLFTNNKTNLMNGVNSMFPYGRTACYDAIIRSIQNASAQSGARCVIVFTDGLDNESVNTVDSVIQLAKEKSVPVYTIGVGSSLDVAALQRIADETGGTYHHIDDVSAMSRVYDEIYTEQKNLYHIKYLSDVSTAETAERKIIVTVSGKGYMGECETVYTPVVPVKAASHGSRYEVIKADISWEDANRECINKGGHLATITSYAEEQAIIEIAEKSGIDNLWIGGYTTNDRYGDAMGHWVMGESFVYQNWYPGEPSRFDRDNEAEFYLMLWKIDNVWSWNDQRNDLINSQFSATYKGKMGYVIEYEN